MHEVTELEPEKLRAAGLTAEDMKAMEEHTLAYIKAYVSYDCIPWMNGVDRMNSSRSTDS